ncbi:MAG: STAS domain-containing protein [Methanobrevibacter sp.]|jgi:anti-anti-sigma factor|nr:STAS domain-containing protein [Candidatus Methanovirga australis]
MRINKKRDKNKMTIEVFGRLDIDSSHELEEEIMEVVPEISELILDFKDLEYISSSGLRVILTVQKLMESKKGKLIIKNINSFVIDIFKTTNIIKLLNIQ